MVLGLTGEVYLVSSVNSQAERRRGLLGLSEYQRGFARDLLEKIGYLSLRNGPILNAWRFRKSG